MSFVFLSLNNNSNSVKSLVVISLLSIVIVELFCRCIRHPNKCSPRCYDWKDCAVHCLPHLDSSSWWRAAVFRRYYFFLLTERQTGSRVACSNLVDHINTKTNCRKVAFVCVILRQTPQNPAVFDKTPTEL